MLHLLWHAHLFMFGIVYLVFILKYVDDGLERICKNNRNIFLKVVAMLSAPIYWALMAFFWELSLPYIKSIKFREFVNAYFDDLN